MTDYSIGDVARILKVSPRRLRYWRKTQLVASPSDKSAGNSSASVCAEASDDTLLDSSGDSSGESSGDSSRDASASVPGEVSGKTENEGYGFRDLVVLRAIVSMIDRGIPLQRIRRHLDVLRDRLPDLADPAGALRLASDSADRVALRRDGRWEEVGGQLLLEFSSAAAETPPNITSLAGPDASALRDPRTGPTDAVFWFEKGCELDVDSREWPAAALAYEKAIEIDSEYADAYCNLGAVRYNQGQRAAARRAFEACLVRAPDHVEANFNLANVLEEAGEDELALTLYRRALTVDPVYPDLHINLALLYEKLGRMRPACRHWRRYLQIDPQGSWSTVARQRLARESEQA